MSATTFWVEGPVRGWARAGTQAYVSGGRARVRHYQTDEDRAWEARIAQGWRRACRDPYEGAVAVLVDVWRPLPESRPRRVESEPDTYKPDADNVTKSVLDALSGLAYADDRQVTVVRVVKHDRERGAEERMRVSVGPAGEYLRGLVATLAPDMDDFDD